MQACDTCRTMNRQCEREGEESWYCTCKYCVETGSPCDCSLAMLNSSRRPIYQNRGDNNHALQEYQMQLMLLEQQRKKQFIQGRQQAGSMMLTPSHSQPMSSSSPYSQPPSNAFQDHRMQEKGLRKRNEQRSPEATKAAADEGSQQAQDNQARSPLQKYDAPTTETRPDQVAKDHFALMPTTVSTSPTQSDHHHHPTDPSQSDMDLHGNISTPVLALE